MRIKGVVALICAGFVVLAVGVTVAAAGNGATVLRGTFQSNELFLVNGTPTLYVFTCNEQRVQLANGSARDTSHCRLDPGQTPPQTAAQGDAAEGYWSDFAANGAPGFAGNQYATSWHGVVTPSGNVTMVATFAP